MWKKQEKIIFLINQRTKFRIIYRHQNKIYIPIKIHLLPGQAVSIQYLIIFGIKLSHKYLLTIISYVIKFTLPYWAIHYSCSYVTLGYSSVCIYSIKLFCYYFCYWSRFGLVKHVPKRGRVRAESGDLFIKILLVTRLRLLLKFSFKMS